jgi:effector-binding domain-containing protein
MEVKVVERNEMIIGGYSIETTLKNSEEDLKRLYNDLENGKIEILNNFSKNTKEYYAVLWYTKLHKSYKYLVGQEISNGSGNFEVKILPEGMYAYTKFPQNYDGIKAWTDFYEIGIPKTGYKPKENDDVAFEYYPNGLNGEYELWSLVENNER